MLPVFKQTQFISKSGDTELIYIVHNKRKSPLEVLAEKWESIPEAKRYIITQKSLGIGLVAVGIIATITFPKDAMGGLVASGMGLFRVVCND